MRRQTAPIPTASGSATIEQGRAGLGTAHYAGGRRSGLVAVRRHYFQREHSDFRGGGSSAGASTAPGSPDDYAASGGPPKFEVEDVPGWQTLKITNIDEQRTTVWAFLINHRVGVNGCDSQVRQKVLDAGIEAADNDAAKAKYDADDAKNNTAKAESGANNDAIEYERDAATTRAKANALEPAAQAAEIKADELGELDRIMEHPPEGTPVALYREALRAADTAAAASMEARARRRHDLGSFGLGPKLPLDLSQGDILAIPYLRDCGAEFVQIDLHTNRGSVSYGTAGAK
jgi:hypothetical protein